MLAERYLALVGNHGEARIELIFRLLVSRDLTILLQLLSALFSQVLNRDVLSKGCPWHGCNDAQFVCGVDISAYFQAKLLKVRLYLIRWTIVDSIAF